MDDLISRAAACACIGKMIKEYREKGEDDLADGMILARRYGIKRLPSIDTAPVVRCKDCKWRHDEAIEDVIPEEYYCHNIDCNVPGKFFCADGERRKSE